MKILELPHAESPYRCPVNGLSDIYQWRTGKRLPELFLHDSRLGCKVLSVPGGNPETMVFFGEGGIGQSEYNFWSEIIGYQIFFGENLPFAETIQKLYDLIDRGIPVILFGLDMFHLPYHENFYHKTHIAGHINLMVGYDDDIIYVHDNDRLGVQQISHNDLQQAWKDGYLGISKKNTWFGIDMNRPNTDISRIFQVGFSATANNFLNPPTNFYGAKGYLTLAQKLEEWAHQDNTNSLKNICMHMITFTASTIPELPKKLLPYDNGIDNPHQAGRDTFSTALRQYADNYGNKAWEFAAGYFLKSGKLIEEMTEYITDIIISDNYKALKMCIPYIYEIYNFECRAFEELL